MNILTIDTHELYLKLKSAGFEDSQTEALVFLFMHLRDNAYIQMDSIENNVTNMDRSWEKHQIHMKWVLWVFSVVGIFLYAKSLF